MNNKKLLSIIGYTGWCGLGFYRGINYYKYNHNKYETKENFLYSSSIVYGFYGLFIYANPFLLPILSYKEIYRLECNVRNLENEKKEYYYRLL